MLVEPLALVLAWGDPSSIDPAEQSPDSYLYAGSGVVRVVDTPQRFSVGEEVIFVVDSRTSDSCGYETNNLIPVDENLIFKKPAALSSTEAASLSSLFFLAVSSVSAALGVTCDVLFAERDGIRDDRAFLLVGGTTPLGSAILQIIHAARPDAFVMTTFRSPDPMMDEERLSAMSIDQIMLGAKYAIDHNADDLADHLRSALDADGRTRVNCVVDTLGRFGGREQVLQDLVSQSQAPALDVSSAQLSSGRLHSLSRLAEAHRMVPLVATLERLLTHNHFRLPSCIRIEERTIRSLSDTVQCCSGREDSLTVFSAC